MKYICLFICLLSLAVAFSAHAEPYNPCEENVCIASFDFGFNVRFGGNGAGGSPPAETYFWLREASDDMLREDASKFLRENSP